MKQMKLLIEVLASRSLWALCAQVDTQAQSLLARLPTVLAKVKHEIYKAP